ncbi:MAG: asparagine synthase (glutamine-hydrolyzing) [Chthoniobacteraceae bacterium]
MCGIAGFIDHQLSGEAFAPLLDAMLRRIVHRGPDGQGTHTEAPLAMGMRRLSIIDLEGGQQPIWNEDHTIGVVFNGEIYNYRELRDRLSGHTFVTHSDTEVLVHLYEEYGTEMFNHLRGMFAFAIYDRPRRRLVVARDHFGQKPLYYYRAQGAFAFASELKCLFAHPFVPCEVRNEAFYDYAAWLSLPSPDTHFRGIHKLPAAHYLVIPLDTPENAKPLPYWHYDLSQPPTMHDLDAAAEALDSALHESLDLHLRADVPIGVLLSSGLDSRTVSAYAQELQEGRLTTFSVGFAGPDSELPGAAATAKEINSRHFELELTAEDYVENLPRTSWHLDEPVGDPAAFAVLKICELARQHVKVLLSGEGADELFAGYDARYLGMLHTLDRTDRLRWLGQYAPSMPASSTSRLARLFRRSKLSPAEEIITLRLEGFPGDVRHPRGFTSLQLQRLQERTGEIARRVVHPQRDRLGELLTTDLDWQLAESLLQKADKMSMGASIELRTPILDTGIAAFAARLDSSLKLPAGGPGKLVQRRCLAKRLKEDLKRPKKGFPLPLRQWLTGPLRERCEATIFAPNAHLTSLLDPTLLRSAWNDFQQGTFDATRIFHSLWLYEIWRGQLAATAKNGALP